MQGNMENCMFNVVNCLSKMKIKNWIQSIKLGQDWINVWPYRD